MKRRNLLSLFVLLPTLGLLVAATQPDVRSASPDVGGPAPDFTLTGTDGKTYTLSDLEGKYVVLEWLNFGCPYVKMHYETDTIPQLQETYTGKDVVWLSVVSSAPGKQGHHPPEEMNAINAELGGSQTAILLDPTGEVGQAYGAQTTPHMYVISPEGTLLYKGGIDDMPNTNAADRESATNYVAAALEAAMNGEEIEVEAAPPYGCSVKYAAN